MTGEGGDKPESDVEADEHVARSRRGGRYVGRASGEDDFDAGQTGSEARAEHNGDPSGH
ncbi:MULTISPECIES: hypothetical protein [Mycolicibacterium]|uniref:hypothetical protein n=1 Tax=Mycolicibacterium TaxID=1866885 RepID=UPI001E2D9D18|nr:hypothetical protein [Mycolicibacterium mageritense]MBN3452887.1 hypothetical protein [Mycobacterium sp. DSM 3803]GJJ18566.1 hypothetical protein MTY414_22390 [Mycolicibacterium mageritense]